MKRLSIFGFLLIAAPAFGQALKVETTPNPAAAGSSQVNRSFAQDGSPILSWIEPQKESSFAFRYFPPTTEIATEANGVWVTALSPRIATSSTIPPRCQTWPRSATAR